MKNIFGNTPKETEYYEEILKIKNNYSKDDKEKDEEHLKNMLARASSIARSSYNFRTIYESGEETRL